ncbi:hypothetical protein [Nonomuraea sp. NPDC050310]|uniref:ATP-grasp domain-containing protein n=1 Tax=Nonomuraea sp. NPDC050310 TaxID=3154935 RepID=UPI0033E65C7E
MRVVIVSRGDQAPGLDHRDNDVAYVISGGPQVIPWARHIEDVGDLSDPALVLKAAGLCVTALGGVDAIVVLDPRDLYLGGLLRERLEVPGHSLAFLRGVLDDAAAKERVAAAGLSAPRFAQAATMAQVRRFVQELGSAAVVRPAGGRPVVVPYGLDPAIVFGAPELGPALVEEFVPGPVWHVDGLVHQGRPRFARASRYLGTRYGYERGEPLGSVERSDAEAETMTAFALACLRALGVADAVFQAELVQAESGPAFLGLDLHPGGPAAEVLREVHGADLARAWIGAQLGQAPGPFPPPVEHAGYLLVPGRPGRTLRWAVALAGRLPGLYGEAVPPAGHLFQPGEPAGVFRFRLPAAADVERSITAAISAFTFEST